MNVKSLMRFALLAALALPVGCAHTAATAPSRRAFQAEVPVTAFTIVPENLPGTSNDNRGEGLRSLLAQEAAASAQEALHRAGLTQTAATVSGTVRMPVSLPPDVVGLRADRLKGPLAVATVRLLGPDGRTIREAEATLTWRQARWLEGAPRFRRNRPPERVLREAAHEVVARAMERLR